MPDKAAQLARENRPTGRRLTPSLARPKKPADFISVAARFVQDRTLARNPLVRRALHERSFALDKRRL
jgi:hypothetical protein